jgi:hypothetical protein
MPLDLRVKSLRFSGTDEQVSIGDSDLIVLIGPNNAGKSLALREIASAIDQRQETKVLAEIEIDRQGTEADLLRWLTETGRLVDSPGLGQGVVGEGAGFRALSEVTRAWHHPEGLSMHSFLFLVLLNAESRLQLTGRVGAIAIRDGHASTPLQRLLLDHAAEDRLSQAVSKAFGSSVTLTRAGGADLQLLLGETVAEARVDNPAYVEELRALPTVEDQGDGMRSFVGILLTLIATSYKLVLIDEPEAFLHPPQAREIGRQLAKLGESQRIIATHDSDVLLGLIESGEGATVIRLQREGDRNVSAVLEKEQVKELWLDPSLRYSNLLDGLFHKGVVICEAEGDATIYGAALGFEREATGAASADILFTQCHGKHRMPKAIGTLVPMGVPVAAILDLDALRDKALLKRIVEALGAEWKSFQPDWNIVAKAVERVPVDAPTIESVRAQIEASLGDDPTARLSEEQTRRIREITTSSDGWRRLKDSGVAAIPHGDATAAAHRLLSGLEAIGAFLVPNGQLEGWSPEIGRHGPPFVAQALANRAYEGQDIRDFVARVAAFLLGGD